MKKQCGIGILLIMIVLLNMSGCMNGPGSWWTEPVIAVMADSTEWAPMQHALSRTFEQVVRTPQSEHLFSVRRISNTKEQLDRYSTFRYVIIAATPGTAGPVGEMIASVMQDSSVQARLAAGEFIIYSQRDQWARDQLVVILLAEDVYSLRDHIERNGDYLYSLFDEDLSKKMMDDLLDDRYDKVMEDDLMSSFGWSLKVHPDYIINHRDAVNGVVFFRRTYPERWILVHWIDNADSSWLNPQWVIEKRNQLGEAYYQGDFVVDAYLFSRKSEFLGRPAVITRGLWEADESVEVAGGPFKNYTFYDEIDKRLYMIDVAVHAPHREKLPLIRRQEQIAKTFCTLFDREKE